MTQSNEPDFAEQLDSDGVLEKVDITEYSIKIICGNAGCENIRYIKMQDKHQVKLCKPCARKYKLAKRAAAARNKRRDSKNGWRR